MALPLSPALLGDGAFLPRKAGRRKAGHRRERKKPAPQDRLSL
jgi:hypothetical protein